MGPSSYCGTAIMCRIVFCCLLLLHFFIDKSWVSNGLRMSSPQASSFLVSACLLLVVVLPCSAKHQTGRVLNSCCFCPRYKFQKRLQVTSLAVQQCSSAAVQLPLETKNPRPRGAPRRPEAPRSRGSGPPLHPSSLRTPAVSWPVAVMSCHSVMFCEGDKAQHKTKINQISQAFSQCITAWETRIDPVAIRGWGLLKPFLHLHHPDSASPGPHRK